MLKSTNTLKTKYHKDIDAIVFQFVSTPNFDRYNWNKVEVTNKLIKKKTNNIKILLEGLFN
jgi:hypothetical protein